MANVLTRQEHPLVFVISHWINLICMAAFIISGFYIHWPFVNGFMGLARSMHLISVWVVLINLVYRIIAAFMVRDVVDATTGEVAADIKTFLPQKVNRGKFFKWIGYYLFFTNNKPVTGKYGNLQKWAYNLVPVMILAAAFTGFSIYPLTYNLWPFSWAVGMWGLMALRTTHYYIMWVIIIFTMIHVYLANCYGFQPTVLMLTWRQPDHGIPATEKDLVGTGMSTITVAEYEKKFHETPPMPLGNKA
jgi:Ni/Fe-hydrogenase 1 B-type cytochrome subunit